MPVTNDAASVLGQAPPDVPTQQSQTPDQIPMQVQAPQPQAPAVPSSVAPAASPDMVHHSILGRAVKALYASAHGQDTAYNVNPQTGEMETTTTPGKPSTFFRNLVLGSLIGGAVGSSGGGKGGFMGAFSRGAAAGAESTQARAQQIDQQKRAQAQQQFNNQVTARKLSDEESTHQATVAHINAQIAGLHQHQSEMVQSEIDKKNAASRAYQKTLVDSGGKPVKITIGGNPLDTVSADQFGAAVVKDPSLLNAPDGYARHFVDTTDLSELHFDGGRWVDDSGSPVNMSAKSSIRAYDVPTATFKQPSQVSGKTINAARGAKIVDDNKTYSVSPEGMSSLYALGLKDQNERARTAHQQALADKHDANQKKFGQIEIKKQTALSKAEHTYWTGMNSGKADPDKALTQLNFEKQQAQSLYEDEIRANGGTPQHFEYGNAPAPRTQAPATAKPSQVSPNVDRALNLVGKLPKDQQAAQINSSTKLTPAEKKQALARIGQ